MIACEARIWPIGDASGGEPGLRADPVELREHLVEPVVGCLRAQRLIDSRDDAGRDVVARGEHGDARHERRHELVADVLVDDVGRLPERVDVDAGVEPGAASASASASPETRWRVSASG